MLRYICLLILLSVSYIRCWEALPEIPTGRRSQYLVLHENGGYKYGYDTGDGSAAEQSGDATNQVEGRYLYDTPSGEKLSIKYTAGIQGFVPEGIPTVFPNSRQYSQFNTDDQSTSGDASYSFTIDSDSYKRQEMADARGNVKGSFSYNNEAGTHDLSYIAGENTGFVATSGSLATPNGIQGRDVSHSGGYTYNSPSNPLTPTSSYTSTNSDGSYSFGYSVPEASQQQSGDANGNVKGSYSYRNSAGTHDLSYIAGSDTGFVATGGSLSQPNGLSSHTDVTRTSSQIASALRNRDDESVVKPDGSYSYGFSTPDASQEQSADANGNVKGSYSYKNSAGTHDLTYIAGSGTGFLPTGGSLLKPNGLVAQTDYVGTNSQILQGVSTLSAYSLPSTDGSYSFEYSSDDSSRKEIGDTSGNVQGSYSYRNQDGNHDLSYVAGSSTGFQVTGGSLAIPNGLGNSNINTLTYNTPQSQIPVNTYSQPQESDLSDTGDASYSFTIDTDNYKRTETSDASGNVQGSFSYRNAAGTNDLSFVADSATGFQPTGGSLSNPNGIPSSATLNTKSLSSISSALSTENDRGTDDASYAFSFDTGEYKRTESSDSNGNVIGSYSYRNSVGQHDLSYEAGAERGFLATGGSLTVPPGLTETQLRSGGSSSEISAARTALDTGLPSTNSIQPSTKNVYRVGNLVVNSYLPPNNEKKKFGYIFDTKY